MNYLQVFTQSKSKLFLISLTSFIIGIAISNFLVIDVFIIFCLILLLLFWLIINWKNIGARPIILCGLFLLIGILRYQISLPDFTDENKIYHYNGNEIELTGTVIKVDERISNQKLTIKSDVKKGKVLITLPLYPKYNYGDQLNIVCQLQQPEPFKGFNYEKYLARYDIYSVCYYPDVNFIQTTDELSLSENLFSKILITKQKLSTSLNFSIPEPQVSILQAMVLGNRRGIPQDILEKFSNVGVSHIIAISGMHIMIIIMILMSLAIFCGLIRQKAFWLATLTIIFYVILIGAPASAVRAAIMGILILYAQKIGRLNYSINALIFAAALMLAVNPKLLISDVGFQLSFMAALGIIYLLPIFRRFFENRKKYFSDQIMDIIYITISAQIMTLPLIIFYFEKLSLVSILANLLILPVIPFVMVLGLINSVVGIFSIALGRLIGYLSWLATSYVLSIVNWLDKIPFGHIEIRGLNVFFVVILYGVILFFIYHASREKLD